MPSLTRHDHALRTPDPAGRGAHPLRLQKPPGLPATALKANRAAGTLHLGSFLLMDRLPDALWAYELGGKASLEHLLDGFRSRAKPYRQGALNQLFPKPARLSAAELAELHAQVARLATVAVETVRITAALAAASPLRPGGPGLAAAAPTVLVAPPGQGALDFGRPADPPAPPATMALALARSQSDFYLLHRGGPRGGNALECLLDAHDYAWDPRVASYDVTEYWQGRKEQPGAWVASLVLTPG